MIKHYLILFLLAQVIVQTCSAQDYEWAFSANTIPRSSPVTVKKDQGDNIYFAYNSDSVTVRKSCLIEKRNSITRQIKWQNQIIGNATISDVEINASNHAVITGYFKDTINVSNQILTSPLSVVSGFILELDSAGAIVWIHSMNPVTNGDFLPKDLFIASDGMMYLTSEINGAQGFCAFHKLDSQGQILVNIFNNDFEVRTFSHVISDADGNLYLSGTCGNNAHFDTIAANPNFSYQNFLIKYDSSFTTQWFLSQNYITFDDNNSLGTSDRNLYWMCDGFSSNLDTTKILKISYSGQVLQTVDAPLAYSFFPGVQLSVNRTGSTLIINAFNRLYLYRYDTNFNIVWYDSLQVNFSGYPLKYDVQCYDSSFYVIGVYGDTTLLFNNIQLTNPNIGANYPYDVFVCKWGYGSPLSVPQQFSGDREIQLYPNPAHEVIFLKNNFQHSIETLYDTDGRIIFNRTVGEDNSGELKLNGISPGIYFLKLSGKKPESSYLKLIIN